MKRQIPRNCHKYMVRTFYQAFFSDETTGRYCFGFGLASGVDFTLMARAFHLTVPHTWPTDILPTRRLMIEVIYLHTHAWTMIVTWVLPYAKDLLFRTAKCVCDLHGLHNRMQSFLRWGSADSTSEVRDLASR